MMDIKIKQIDQQEWCLSFKNDFPNTFFSPEYLNITSEVFKLHLSYYIYTKGDCVLFAAAVFSRGKKVVIADAFNYSSIYFDRELGDITYGHLFNSFLRLLKIKFNHISFRLSPSFKDLRPFIWGRFSIVNRYTYLRKTADDIPSNILKKIKNDVDRYICKSVTPDDFQLDLILKSCFNYGLNRNLFEPYKSFFKALIDLEIFKIFAVFDGDRLMCTQALFLDSHQKTAYTFLMNDMGNKKVSTLLYVSTHRWLNDKGYVEVDMVGANDMGIGNFKYSFNAVLTPYYLVTYDNFSDNVSRIPIFLKTLLKRLFRR